MDALKGLNECIYDEERRNEMVTDTFIEETIEFSRFLQTIKNEEWGDYNSKEDKKAFRRYLVWIFKFEEHLVRLFSMMPLYHLSADSIAKLDQLMQEFAS